MLILNLGCGRQTSPRAVNIDWSLAIRVRQHPVLRALARFALDRERRRKLDAKNGAPVVLHDLARGIPYPDDCVDVVYHSHFLEHIERDQVPRFLREVYRVLKAGGIHRLVVPDQEFIAYRYLASLAEVRGGCRTVAEHEAEIADGIERMVRKESEHVRGLAPWRRWLETRVFGDARALGETHQWAYDRVTLTALLVEAGFVDPTWHSYATSTIPDWDAIGLDRNPTGGELHRPGSMYVEARKPRP